MTFHYDALDECVNSCAPAPTISVVRGLFIDDGDKALGSPRFVASEAGRFIDITTPAFEGVLHEDEAYPLLKQLTAVLL
ncbi:hypothetical protein CcrC1_gp076 [Caulobacter phage C1]|nr:hypothetical protein CcrC1_gp076 [Caulobacter phage C1]UTU08304.1 hypothetical protein CcrC2_gp076 [Caulobacter phage C2]UTU08825.1 hypothetical protein CcrJ4_gp074 [Caulobacter phage J4]UTU09378.1 hypothetical protein CcrBL47_gp092 [Caulobacter phage BL47]UTU09938.1 hypothetical protein CcrRB23_gp076 [Caulobacter phage RB23]WGN96963.1 hypothetical protein [Bertelyvirus sp.]